MRDGLLDPGSHGGPASAGLLLLRAAIGAMMLAGHGWGKLVGFGTGAASFPDPLRIGHGASMAATIGAEFFCSLLVVVGFGTRIAVLPLVFTMAIAAFVVLGGHPWADQELAVAYLVPFAALAFTGAGRYSMDAVVVERLRVKS